MNPHSNLTSLNIAFGGLAGFSCQDDRTKPQLYYQDASVQMLQTPCPAHFSQSNANQNDAHPINPLSEFRVTSLTQAVPGISDESDLTVIPKSTLDEFVPWNSDNDSVDNELLPTPGSYQRDHSCFAEIEPDIWELTPANRVNLDNHLTHFPAELANPQNSWPVAVVNPLNLQQATINSPVNSAKIITGKPSQAERKREGQQNDPAIAKHESERKTKSSRERRKDPVYAKRERERRRELEMEHCRNDPTYAERKRKRKRELERKRYHNNPEYAEREKARRKNPVYAERHRELQNKRRERRAQERELLKEVLPEWSRLCSQTD